MMSATLHKEDQKWLIQVKPDRPLTATEKSLVLELFESQTDYDVKKIYEEMKTIKFLKRICVLKLLMFIPKYIYTYLFFEMKYHINEKRAAVLYYQFLFNKINLETFQNELKVLTKEGIISS